MATGKVVGQIQVTQGNIKIVGVDGAVREPGYEGYVYENEQVISNDPNALFQIKFLALPEASAYDGIFRILADGSVIHGRDAMDSVVSDENLVKVLETASVGDAKTAGEDIGDLETAAGEEGAEGSSSFTETDIVAESSVLGFGRGPNPAVTGLDGIEVGAMMTDDPNRAPIANADLINVDEDGSVTVAVLANDTDADGILNPATVVITTQPTNGSVSVNPVSGEVTYTPDENYNGPDSFAYTVEDNQGTVSNPATVGIAVNPVNDPATVSDDAGSVTEDTVPYILTTSGTVIVADADTGESLAIAQASTTGSNGYGIFTVDENGAWTYSADNTQDAIQKLGNGETLTDSFTVTSVDETASGTVTVTITGTNDQPVVTNIDVNFNNPTWLLGASTTPQDGEDSEYYDTTGASKEDINALFSVGEGSVEVSDIPNPEGDEHNPTDGAAIKFTMDVEAGETVTFNWIFNDAEGYDGAPDYDNDGITDDGYRDFSFVVIDGKSIELLADTYFDGNTQSGVFTYTFEDAGQHEITFGVMNDDDEVVDSSLQISHISGGTIVSTDSVGYVENMINNTVYETHDLDQGEDSDTIDDANNVITGTLSVLDVDVNDTHTFEVDTGSVYVDGELVEGVSATIYAVYGEDEDVVDHWEYRIEGDFSYLSVDENTVVTFDYVAIDDSGVGLGDEFNEPERSEPATIKLTLIGTNDQPIVTDVTVEAVEYEEIEGSNVFIGQLAVADDDVTDTHTYEVVTGEGSTGIYVNGEIVDDVSVTIYLNEETGKWEYEVEGDFNYLSADETATVTFSYVAIDDSGVGLGDEFNESERSEPATVTLIITGTNDAPVITGGPDTDLLDETNAALTATGTMTVGDVDTTDNVTASVDGVVITGTSDRTDAAAPTDAELKAMLTVAPTAIIDGTENSDTLTWSFNSDSEAFDYLAAGETLILTYTVKATDDVGTPLSDTETVTITITGTNDIPTIEGNTIYATEDIAYTITLADFEGFADIDGDEMSAIRIDSLPDNDSGVLKLDGVAVAVGDEISVADINSGLLYLTTLNNGDDTSFTFSASDGMDWSLSPQTMTIDVTPVTDTVRTDTLSVSMTVLPPVIDTSTLTMDNDINETDSNIFETEDGLKLTGPEGTIVQVNTNGNGLGIDSSSGSNDARDIDGVLSEWLQIEFPTGTMLNEINIDVKHASDDVIRIKLYESASSVDPIASVITYQIDGIGTVHTLGSDGLIDGSLLTGNAKHTITISSTTSFVKMLISDNTGASGGTDGFSALNVYGTVSSTPDSYDSIIHLNGLGLGDTDGSEEISTITLSGFPTGSTITLPDGVTEIEADGYGNWVIDAADLGLDSNLDLTNDISMTLTSPIAISSTFVPTVDIVTTENEIGIPVSHTILGGSEDDTLTGGDGNDYIDGGVGDDTLIGGAGNDTIEYDAFDTEIDGGVGFDTLIGNADTISLANVSNIEVIQLSAGTTVEGSGTDLGINASDVLSATESGTLIIQSADGDALNNVNIDETSFTFTGNVNNDGIDYAQYTGTLGDDTATLLIELNDNIVVD